MNKIEKKLYNIMLVGIVQPKIFCDLSLSREELDLKNLEKFKEEYLPKLKQIMKKRRYNHIDLLVLPELYPGTMTKDVLEQICDIGINYFIMGKIHEEINKTYNAAYIYNLKNRKIELEKIYAKRNLYVSKNPDLNDEKFFKPGKELGIININRHKIGLTICYDLHSEDVVEELLENGAELILNMSLIGLGKENDPTLKDFEKTNLKHWFNDIKKYSKKVPIIAVNACEFTGYGGVIYGGGKSKLAKNGEIKEELGTNSEVRIFKIKI